MGASTILFRRDMESLWRCQECGNVEEFEEEWFVDIVQDLKEKSQEINLIESINLRCKRCGSTNIAEIREAQS